MPFTPNNYYEDKAYRQETLEKSKKQRLSDDYLHYITNFKDLPPLMQVSIISTTIIVIIISALVIFFILTMMSLV